MSSYFDWASPAIPDTFDSAMMTSEARNVQFYDFVFTGSLYIIEKIVKDGS